MFTIQNELLTISVDAKGAELNSIFHRQHQLSYLWNGNPLFWAKHSPILFPIVGTLKDNQYTFEGKSYQMGRHGFARDTTFSVQEQSETEISFSFASDENTMKQFPFPFTLLIGYALHSNRLDVSFTVSNTGSHSMYFSVGGHPAFKVPLEENTAYEDYYLEFNSIENAGRWPISADGLIEEAPVTLLNNTNILPLTRELFFNDALVFRHLSSNSILLKNRKGPHGLALSFTGFPYLGIWAAKHADFVCIEPWCGIADPVNSSGQLTEKEGINQLPPGGRFEKTYSIEFF